jgi:predicted amidohydrolase
MPNAATKALFERGAQYQMAMSFGYVELTPDGHHFNTCILTDKSVRIVGKYRKVHLPGHRSLIASAPSSISKTLLRAGRSRLQGMARSRGIIGMAICNDRRWPETYRVMGLQGVEMVLLGYNTPSVNSQQSAEGPEKRLFRNRLSVQAGAYQNSTWVVAAAKAGSEDGHSMIAGSLIVDPSGEITAEARTETTSY